MQRTPALPENRELQEQNRLWTTVPWKKQQMFSILPCVSLQEPGPKSLQRRLLLTARRICTIKTLTSESWVEKTSILLPAPELSKQTSRSVPLQTSIKETWEKKISNTNNQNETVSHALVLLFCYQIWQQYNSKKYSIIYKFLIP